MLLDGYYDVDRGIMYSCTKKKSENGKIVVYTIGIYHKNTVIVLGQYEVDLVEFERADITTKDVLETFLDKLYETYTVDELEKEVEKKSSKSGKSEKSDKSTDTKFKGDILISDIKQ